MTRIVVVDDEEAVRKLLRHVLEANGYEVTEAKDGKEVLRMQDLDTADLLITDLVMPDVEGTELIMRVHREHPELPIIALSGSPNGGRGVYLAAAGKLGAQRTLAKPFGSKELLEAVRVLLGD